MISEKDLANLAFNGLRSHLIEKLEGHSFISLSQLQQKTSVQESQRKNIKETTRPSHHNVNTVTYDSSSSNDESSDVLTAEFNWSSKAKS